MDAQALQLIYSLVGTSPIGIILVYYLGKINTRISLLEQQVEYLQQERGRKCLRK